MMDDVLIGCLAARVKSGGMTVEQIPQALKEAVLAKLEETEN